MGDSSTQRDANTQGPRPGERAGDSLDLCVAATGGVHGAVPADEAETGYRALDTHSLRGLGHSKGNGREAWWQAGLCEDKQLFGMYLTREIHSSPKQKAVLGHIHLPGAKPQQLSSPLPPLPKDSPVLSK